MAKKMTAKKKSPKKQVIIVKNPVQERLRVLTMLAETTRNLSRSLGDASTLLSIEEGGVVIRDCHFEMEAPK